MPFNTNSNTPAAATVAKTSKRSQGSHHRPILAERFKTKMCANFVDTGACPYFFRCMFAHGEHEMRDKHMNMADGLYTEDAIKAFKKANYESVKRQAKQAAHAAANTATNDFDQFSSDCHCGAPMHGLSDLASVEEPSSTYAVTAMAIGGASAGTDSTGLGMDDLVSNAASVAPASLAAFAPCTSATPSRPRRHDPYATQSFWHPLALARSIGMLSPAPTPAAAGADAPLSASVSGFASPSSSLAAAMMRGGCPRRSAVTVAALQQSPSESLSSSTSGSASSHHRRPAGASSGYARASLGGVPAALSV